MSNDNLEVMEVCGVTDRVTIKEQPQGTIHIETRNVSGNHVTPQEARYLARQLQRLARKIEVRG